jgi:RimJ/RimL family protein N-acetyltransferase
MKHIIKHKHEEIGYLQLVDYTFGKNPIPQIEYHLDEPYCNQGVMSKELPKYLKLCKARHKKYGDECRSNRLVAIVENKNIISMKLLERNGFVKIKDFDNHTSYIAHLDLDIELVEKMTNYFYQMQQERNKRLEKCATSS